VDTSGKKLGEHPGAWFYTVGQRRDIRIGGGEALFVVAKDVANNRIVVGTAEERELFSNRLVLSDWKWLREDRSFPWSGEAKIRYRQTDQKVRISSVRKEGSDSEVLEAVFETPQRAVAPGQFLVAYEGDELVGSAVISQ
jgi:tRNA-specific 2-thiouridylase